MVETVPKNHRVYILPNLLTTAGLFCGFYGMMAALNGLFVSGAYAIIAATIFDALDGRVARATGTVSAFGKEYDSLADFLSFGVSPALLMYQWVLAPHNRWGWAAAFLFVVCGALRLARFNVMQNYVQDERVSKRYFQGLPIPAAAGFLVAMVLFYHEFNLQTDKGFFAWLPLVMMFVLGILMVSNVRFRSMKDFAWHRKRPFLTLVAVGIFLSVLTIYMAVTLFLVMWIYLISAIPSHREYLGLLAEGKEVEEDEVEDLTI
ncbi:MAG: CDP-diacylglycerol--serine O-phosphatidyltransferase [Magnetococcales bacterium]|nr:CDP-diacylglycerol--serine O-phosphatidyltransferase [Magnetococcales bacterium]